MFCIGSLLRTTRASGKEVGGVARAMFTFELSIILKSLSHFRRSRTGYLSTPLESGPKT